MFIRSERLFLRPGWPEDWEEVLARIGDESVVRNLASAPWPYTDEDAKEFVGRAQERLLPNFLVTLPTCQGPVVIGGAGLGRDPTGGDGAVELGYWIAPDYQGRGYATEAARAVVGLARAIGHRRLVAHHFADNPASGRVLVKAGFAPAGQVRLRSSRGREAASPALGYAVDLAVEGAVDMRHAA